MSADPAVDQPLIVPAGEVRVLVAINDGTGQLVTSVIHAELSRLGNPADRHTLAAAIGEVLMKTAARTWMGKPAGRA